MHPTMAYELVKIKIAEDLEYAARQRPPVRSSAIGRAGLDFSSIGQRLRVRLFGGPALGGTPTATAGA